MDGVRMPKTYAEARLPQRNNVSADVSSVAESKHL
jgi:hypothetical protein